jgi:hypothetical protein
LLGHVSSSAEDRPLRLLGHLRYRYFEYGDGHQDSLCERISELGLTAFSNEFTARGWDTMAILRLPRLMSLVRWTTPGLASKSSSLCCGD